MYTWGKVKIAVMVVLVLLGVIQTKRCGTLTGNALDIKKSESMNSLERIKKRGKLIALTENSSTSYFVYKGEPMGYEFDMLTRFAEHLDVELEIVLVSDMDVILDRLNKGEADIASANLTITNERLKYIDFTEPLLMTKQVLVQRKPKGWQNMNEQTINKSLVRNITDLVGKPVYVRKNSSFYSRLKSLSEEIGGEVIIEEACGDQDTEELISYVAHGYVDFTVADENVAMINQTYYGNIDIKTPISFQQKIAWAVRKDCPQLLAELNAWINDRESTTEKIVLYNKYFINKKDAEERQNSDYFSVSGGRISLYDQLFKEYCKKIDWDWRLLASVVYQESHFDPEAKSWAGAYGLMQLIPATAMRFGGDSLLATPVQNIQAGVSFLHHLDNYWKNYIKDKDERTKFVLASYNVGLGHVIDARNLAKKYESDPDLWTNNVDFYVLNKSKQKYYTDDVVKFGYCRGEEPYNYVKEILNRFEHYKNVVPYGNKNEVLVSR